jgi:lipid-A-disaccharide synthase
MNVRSIMLVAGEPSGDLLAAELARALRPHFATQPFPPRFFGAGGEHLAAAGVEVVEEMTRHAVVGVADVLRSLAHYRRVFHRLLDLAAARTPDLIVLVDFTGFNRRFAHALRQRVLRQSPLFGNWRPRLVQYVSPQVWASRPGRADAMARDLDLLLCLFPFERDWYARRVPQMRVEWVGHPICDRYPDVWRAAVEGREINPAAARSSHLLLLPGSRRAELRRHLPVMLAATDLLAARRELRPRIVLPGETLRPLAGELLRAHRAARPAEKPVPVTLQCGGLADALREARVALASTAARHTSG